MYSSEVPVQDVKLMPDKVLKVLHRYLSLFWSYRENIGGGGGNIYTNTTPSGARPKLCKIPLGLAALWAVAGDVEKALYRSLYDALIRGGSMKSLNEGYNKKARQPNLHPFSKARRI